MSNPLPTISILTDDIEDDPILDFEKYADTIVKMIIGSKPRFSVGIYGEWGTGKTTLMRLIEKKLRNNENILTVWFNAWRYEREDQFALVALMKTIAHAMGDLPRYQEIKKVLLRGLGIIGKDVLRNLALRYAMTEKGLKDLEEKLLPKMDLLSSIDKDTIYFDGLRKIEEEMEKISKANNYNYNNNRIIIFIDDLDRCSPKTTLEVFESIKVILGLEGFIYVVGLSHETISKLVSLSYKDSDIKGEHYLRKVIQIPITIPDWNDAEVIQDLVHNLSTKLEYRYSKLVQDNKELISKAVEPNPREIKRFINNFIVSIEIYSNSKVNAKELLVVQALKVRWNKFYSYLSSDEQFRDTIKKYLEMSEDDRSSRKRNTDNNNHVMKASQKKLFEFESDYDLWIQKLEETLMK